MRLRKKIVRRSYDQSHANLFTQYPELLKRIYASRQVQSQDALERELKNLLPFEELMNIKEGSKLLGDHIIAQKNILIIGDFDTDGATSTALAMRALKMFGAHHINYLVPNRFAFGYGLTPELVEVSLQFNPHLIVTVDNGIANHKGVEAANQKSIKVMITDHHLLAENLPDAEVIINPNQSGDLFPSKNLAGVGVIFYVMLAVRRYLIDCDWFSQQRLSVPNMANLLGIVALGTVADLVPLDHNNRILVHQGLKRINAGQCIPGIYALLEVAGRNFLHANATDLGFAVAARLNAAGRLDDMSLGIECLLVEDPIEARTMAKHLHELNNERRSIEATMQHQAIQVVNQLNLKGDLPMGLCLYDDEWHQGVIGILAARIKDKYYRPVIVFANGIEDELKGSARSIHGLHIRDVLSRIDTEHPNLIKKYGGHSMAAGLSITKTFLKDFVTIFDQTVSQMLTKEHLEHAFLSDGSLSEKELNLDIAEMIKNGGPWGQAFPEPLFDDEFEVIGQRIVGDKHLKLQLMKNEKILDAIYFFADLGEWPNHRCKKAHVVYRLAINEFKGRRKIQLLVEYLYGL